MTIYIQRNAPDNGRRSNSLPAPDGRFRPLMRVVRDPVPRGRLPESGSEATARGGRRTSLPEQFGQTSPISVLQAVQNVHS